jgi:hypothetical protein
MASHAHFYRCRTLLAFEPLIKPTLRWSAVEMREKRRFFSACPKKAQPKDPPTAIITATDFRKL